MTDTDLDALEKRFSTVAYEPLSREATLVLVRALADLRDRIATIASEAFGPFPVQTLEEDLTAIERGIHEAGRYGEEWRARAEKLQQADEMDHRGVLVERLRAALADRERERSPLDPAHVEALQEMLAEERAKHGASKHAQMRHYREQHIAALTAVLGETEPT